MHFVWLMTTVVLFVSFFDDGNVKGNNLEIQVNLKLQELTDLKERTDSSQNNNEWHISSFLNNKFLTKINSMERGLVQEKIIRINLENKIKSMEKLLFQKQAILNDRLAASVQIYISLQQVSSLQNLYVAMDKAGFLEAIYNTKLQWAALEGNTNISSVLSTKQICVQ